MRNKRRKVIILVMSIILLVFGSIILLNRKNFNDTTKIDADKLKTKVIAKNDEESLESIESKELIEENNVSKPIEKSTNQADNTVVTSQNNVVPVQDSNPYYIATLKIPKIGLQKGLVPKDSPDNNLEKNVETLMESDYPDVTNGNLILAAHSGNMKVSFFSRLLEIGVGDTAEVVYNGKTYVYRVNNIYDIPKTGYAEIIRDANRTTLTLITCRQGTDYQAILICYLENVY